MAVTDMNRQIFVFITLTSVCVLDPKLTVIVHRKSESDIYLRFHNLCFGVYVCFCFLTLCF